MVENGGGGNPITPLPFSSCHVAPEWWQSVVSHFLIPLRGGVVLLCSVALVHGVSSLNFSLTSLGRIRKARDVLNF